MIDAATGRPVPGALISLFGSAPRSVSGTDVGPDEWSDPTTLQRLAATATRLTLGDGQQKTLDVRTGGSAQR